jgi:hypothetical protein
MASGHEDTTQAGFALSLVRGDALTRWQRRIGLIPRDGLGIGRRAVFWALFAWLPIATWALLFGRALPGAPGEPLFDHFGVHVRFLVAVPLFFLGEGMAHRLTTTLLPHFVRSGIVPPAEVPKFRAALADMARLRDALSPWVVILGLVVAWTAMSVVTERAHEVVWAVEGEGAARHLGFGGWWLLLAARPVFTVLLLGWLWRLMLLLMLMRRIARLELAIVPTHPDRAGGLGFVERFPKAFSAVVLAIAAVLASSWGHDVVYHDVSVLSLRGPMIAFVIVVVVLFLAPYLVFAGPLLKAKRQALLDYGALVGRHGWLVRRRWVSGDTVEDDAILAAPELGPVADTLALYDSVARMRPLPLGLPAVLAIVAPAVIPMIPVLAIEIPIKQLLGGLVKALV